LELCLAADFTVGPTRCSLTILPSIPSSASSVPLCASQTWCSSQRACHYIADSARLFTARLRRLYMCLLRTLYQRCFQNYHGRCSAVSCFRLLCIHLWVSVIQQKRFCRRLGLVVPPFYPVSYSFSTLYTGRRCWHIF
jgi:hypothetical protein